MQLKIFPFGELPNGKRVPLLDDWERNASADPAQHKLWIEQYRDRLKGWALPTKVNGLFALDIDVKDGRNGFEYLKSQGIQLPQTAWQQTASGGAHLFFQDDPNLNLRNTVNRETGVDTRAGGGFVWLHDNIYNIFKNPVLPIPEWVHTIVRKPVNQIDPTRQNQITLDPKITMERFYEALGLVLSAQSGERNQRLNTASYLIGKLVAGGGIPYDFAYSELTRAAQSIGLDPYEIQATSLSGLKGGASQPYTHPFGDAPPVPALNIQAPLPQAPEPRPRWTPTFATFEELTDWTKLKRPQLFKDWSPQDIILTSAVGGVGKSTIKLYESVCLALGDSFLGFECINPGRTLMIIGEDSTKKMYAMLGRICKQIGLFEPGQEHRLRAVQENVVVKHTYDLALVAFDPKIKNYIPNQEAIDQIKEAIDDLKPKHIILDPIGVFGGSEAGGNDSAKAMMQAIQKIRDLSDAAVDIVSHVGKDSATKKDVGQFSARGATAMANHSRVIRTLLKLNSNEYRDVTGEELSDGHTAIQCFVSKFSDGSPILDRPFLIIRDGYLFSRKEIPAHITGVNIDSSKDKQRVFDYIRKNSSEAKPLTENFICDHFNLENPRIAKSITKSIIGTLQFEGLIEKAPHIDERVGEWVRSV